MKKPEPRIVSWSKIFLSANQKLSNMSFAAAKKVPFGCVESRVRTSRYSKDRCVPPRDEISMPSS